MADTCPPISAALGDHRHYNDMRPASDSTTASPQQPEQTSHYLHEAQNDNNEPEQGDKMVIDSGDDSAQQPPITEAEADDGVGDGSESDAANGEENEDDDDADDDAGDNAEDSDEGLNRVVAAEIEAVKEIERGPSEATLRRMKLIELDPDEAEEKIERYKRLGNEAISKATGLSRADRIAKLRSSRRYLAPLWKGKQSLDLIETYLEKQLGRLFGDEEPPFDPVAYLEQDAFSDEEDEAQAAAAATAAAAAAAENEPNMIALSDSEDEADDDAPSALPAAAPAAQSPVARGGALSHLKPHGFPPAGAAADAQRKLFLAPMRVVPSSRAALMISLRRQVQRTATENYCAQRRIRQDELQQQLAIADHCRALVELLRDHYLEKEQRIVEERQARYAQMADDEDDAEFGDAGLADGQFLTDEERRRLYRRIRRARDDSDASDDDYVDDGDSDGGDADEDGDEDDDADAMDADDAPEEGNEVVEQELFVDEELAAHDPKPELAAADDDEAPVVRKSSHRPQRASLLDEDDDDAVDERRDAAVPVTATATLSDAADDAQSLADSTRDEDGAAVDGGEEEAEEDGAAAPPREPKQKKERTGNALYRMMLEEDERRFRNQKRSALIDDEAEEEEEEGGIGDFGFGDLANVRDAEDERNAGRLQKGDLDHIVDDVSDGEGDEAAERAAVYQMELQEDRARTKLIVEAITEGHEAFRQRKHRRKQGYSFEALVTGRKAGDAAGDAAAAAAEPNGAEEELDFEEMLQRGLSEKMEREKRRRYNDEDEDEDEDDAAFGDEDDGPGAFAGDLFDEDGQPLFAEGFVGADGEIWTREMIAAEQERIQRDRDARRAEYLRRKQMDKDFKMRRELRYLQLQRAQSLTRQTSASSLSQSQAPPSGLGLAPPSLSSLLPASLPANARVNPAILQRLAPHAAATTTTSFAAAAAQPVAAHTLQKRLKRAATVAPAAGGSASSGGGVTPRGLFQLVTGAAPAASGAAGPAPMLRLLSKKRSFSALLHDGASQLGSRSQPPGVGAKRLTRTHSIV